MTDYSDRVQDLVDVIAAVPGSGIVHRYARATGGNRAKFIQLFVDPATKEVCGWHVTRRAAKAESPRWEETFVLVHVRGIVDADASEVLMQEHLDAVVRRWRPGADQALLSWGAVPDGLDVVKIEEAKFGDVLAHVATCELRVSSYYDAL